MSSWFEEFLDWRIKNEPITVLDHAAICYDSSPTILTSKCPYQIESWCLRFPEIQNLVKDTLNICGKGLSMFKVHKRLQYIRTKQQNDIGVWRTRNFGGSIRRKQPPRCCKKLMRI